MKKTLLYLSIALAVGGCTTKRDLVLFNDTNVTLENAKNSITDLSREARYEYRIVPHDRISITMYNHPELGTTSVQSQKQDLNGVLVNSKGHVRLPLIKSIHVAGLTQTEAQRKIEKAYGKYLEDAEVSLEVLNKRAYILGEVNKPGPIRLFNEKTTLLQLLAQAGDLTTSANRHAIVVMKHRRNKILTQTVDLTGANAIKVATMMIYPNDVVYVTPNGMKAMNVGIKDLLPSLQLAGSVLTPIVNTKYLLDL
ncbi:MAG: polysaccharide biosynthesis/export family protein [Sulfurovum sp.]|nr:polysaccharide biosynthesis/export family protein [Sulfurovum sp.]